MSNSLFKPSEERTTVVYKLHPDTAELARPVFKQYVDRFETRPFEIGLSDADTLLFIYSQMTTLGTAVPTKKDIVLLDIEEPD